MTDMSAPTQIPEGFEWRVGFPRPAFEKRHDDHAATTASAA
jgi:hypothetical protein